MTSPITTTTPTTTTPAASATSSVTGGAILGKDDFLQLLVTQLKNQDPMSPMDGTQFAAQLAQFSTVEQLMQMNTKMDAQATAATASQVSQQAAFATSLIGRDVILNGSTVTATAGTAARINVDLLADAKTVHVDVLGADGKTIVKSKDFTGIGHGSQTLSFDPDELPPGTYTYQVTATDASNGPITVTGNTIGHVDSTVFQQGQIMLRVNGTVVPLTDITEIIPAASSTDPASSSH